MPVIMPTKAEGGELDYDAALRVIATPKRGCAVNEATTEQAK
jgi:hypothetical protein